MPTPALMHRRTHPVGMTLTLTAVAVVTVGAVVMHTSHVDALQVPLYLQPGAPIDQRADDLLAKMTLEEKISQTWAPYSGNAEEIIARFSDLSVGALSYGSVCQKTYTKNGQNLTGPAAQLAWRNDIQKAFVTNSRLKIPISFNNEALHSALPGATVFPEPVSQGTTWDPELVGEIAASIAEDARAVGIDLAFSPVINMWTDSRFGRLQEGFSENPTLTAAYAVAAARGFQGDQPAGKWAYFNSTKVVALAKHYAAYGAAAGGLNGGPAELSERTLREVFLKPWRAFAKAGGKGAMTAHNTVLNRPCHAHPYLVNDIFRDEFNFGDGVIISDCNDIPALVSFRVAADLPNAAAKGMLGGVDWDLQCGNTNAYQHLNESVSAGLVNVSVIEKAVRRSLMEKFATGLFDNPYTDPKGVDGLNSAADQQLALRAAEESAVLLKNAHNVLPLSHTVKKIAVIGPNGHGDDTVRANYLGSYTQWYSNPNVQVPTLYEALTTATHGTGVSVAFNAGASFTSDDRSMIDDAVTLAKGSDVTVVVVGDDLSTSAEWGDRDSLDLPGSQMPLLEAIANVTDVPCIVIHIGGRTPTFGPGNAVLDHVDALIAAFRPGQMGGVALANILTGKTSPSGKLAQNWVRSAGEASSGASPWLQWRVGKWVANNRGTPDPDGRYYDSYRSTGMTYGGGDAGQGDPLFHFGEGLSYTNFSFSNLVASTQGGTPDAPVAVEVDVSNTGQRDGTTVVQIYAEDPIMDYVRPWKRLVAFQRVPLSAGAKTTVKLELTADELSFYDDDMKLRVVPGNYTLSAGGDSYSAGYLTTSIVIDA
eukprot:m.52221 g.52221  ORF g.52221 m.52221 type:complete len:819 (+) comp7359_c0_seq1:68-2524(+)